MLLAWENEAYLSLAEFGENAFDIVVPSVSILAEPPVSLVDGNAEANGTLEVARAYLDHLYSAEGQALVAKHYYRPAKPELANQADLDRFAEVKRLRVEDEFGSWAEVQAQHFADGGIFDQIYRPR